MKTLFFVNFYDIYRTLEPTRDFIIDDVQIQPNDTIEVTGSQVNFSGQPAIMATSVEKDNMTLQLRDENGFPMWHGWRGNSFNREN